MPYPDNFARPLEIAIGASDGASDYGNKFGEPVLAGENCSSATRVGAALAECAKRNTPYCATQDLPAPSGCAWQTESDMNGSNPSCSAVALAPWKIRMSARKYHSLVIVTNVCLQIFGPLSPKTERCLKQMDRNAIFFLSSVP